MKGLSLKYLLKRGGKKTIDNIFRNIISGLLLAVSATLFAYSVMFFLFDPVEVESRFVSSLNEENYKYLSLYANNESLEDTSEKYRSLSASAFSYLDETVLYLKYTNFTMSGCVGNGFNDNYGACFCVIASAEDLLSYGYTFYGDYKKTLSEGEIYISDSYLQGGTYYFYENDEWNRQDYQEEYADKSVEWFSAFVGKEIYLEEMLSAKVKIVGVVNTGYYSLTFRDAGLIGDADEFSGAKTLEEARENALESDQQNAIGFQVYCTEEFLRSYIVKTGNVIVGSELFQGAASKTIKEDFSFSLKSGDFSYVGDKQKVTLQNTVSLNNTKNRKKIFSYIDDKGIHINPRSFSNGKSTVSVNGYGITEYSGEIVSESDVCGEGEIMLSDGLYYLLFGEKIDFSSSLPSHIGEKISLSIRVDGITYNFYDKTLVGVAMDCGYGENSYYYGIICPEDEKINEFMADYITMHYVASINISGLEGSELSSLLHTLYNEYGVEVSYKYSSWRDEAASIEITKNIYFGISLCVFAMTLLFDFWTVLHAVKQDYREIGILRANGVTARDMTVIYGVQFFIIGILTFALSLLGINILAFGYKPSNLHLLRLISYFPELKLYWVGARQVLSLIALNLIVPLLISLFALLRIRKISPVEAINEAKKNE